MARNVFLSFLGTNRYIDVEYLPIGEREGEIVKDAYIQMSRLRELRSRGIEFDAVAIFVTGDARKKNWEAPDISFPLRDGFGCNAKTVRTISYQGLEHQLRAAGFRADDATDIKEPTTTQEIWQLFDEISDAVEPGDRLFVDVTHGLRTMAVILMIALDYVRRAKGASIEEVSYGAFEIYDRTDEAARPTWDLQPFLVLRDWTDALSLFQTTGDTRRLAELATEGTRGVRRELRERTAPQLGDVARKLRDLGDSLMLTRIRDTPDKAAAVCEGVEDAIPALQAHLQTKPVALVLAQIAERARPLCTDGTVRGRLRAQLEAVRWSNEFGRVLQAAAFLRETLVDLIEVRLGLTPLFGKRNDLAEAAAGALNGFCSAASSAKKAGDPLETVRFEVWAPRDATKDVKKDYVRASVLLRPASMSETDFNGNLASRLNAVGTIRNALLHCHTTKQKVNSGTVQATLEREYEKALQLVDQLELPESDVR